MCDDAEGLLSRAQQQFESRRFHDAAQTCREGLALCPDHPRLRYALATALREAGEIDEAIRHYRAALAQAPGVRGIPIANDLGALLLSRGRIEEAEPLLAAAVAGGIRSPLPYRNLGMLKLQRGDFAAAADLLHTRARLDPSPRAHHELGVALARCGDLPGAAERFRHAADLDPAFGPAWCNLALVLEDLGRRDEAAAAMRNAAELEPDSPTIAYHLAALTGDAPPPICPPGYVVELFDGYAGRFDDHLVQQLHYRGPEMVRDAAAVHWTAGPADLLDLGCGTGLCGLLLKPLARRIVGVDLSRRMLDRARQRGVYDELICDDVVNVLTRRPGSAELITAADLLIYLGDLAPLMHAAAAALRPGGLLIVTIETLDAGDYRLLPTRRYAHHARYLRRLAAAAGLAEIGVTESPLRSGASDQDVPGAVMSFRRG